MSLNSAKGAIINPRPLNYMSMNVYKRGTRLVTIIDDGWAMGFTKDQTLREASNAGYANCIAKDAIDCSWAEWDEKVLAEMKKFSEMADKLEEGAP